jgi:hypothetical protein
MTSLSVLFDNYSSTEFDRSRKIFEDHSVDSQIKYAHVQTDGHDLHIVYSFNDNKQTNKQTQAVEI